MNSKINEKTKNAWNKSKIIILKKEFYTRAIAIIMIAITLACFSLTFAELKLSAGVSGLFGNNVTIEDDKTVVALNLGSLLTFKDTQDIELFGKQIKEYKIADKSIYDLLTNPIPNKGYLSSLDKFLTNENISLLAKPEIQQTIKNIFPKNGTDINNILTATSEILTKSRPLVESANNILISMREEMDHIKNIMKQVNVVKDLVCYVVVGLFLFGICIIVLLCIKRINRKIPLIMTFVLFGIFALLSVSILVGNAILQPLVADIIQTANSTIGDYSNQLLGGMLGEYSGIVTAFGGTNSTFLNAEISIRLGAGAILTLFSLILSSVAIYFIPKKV